MTDANRLRKALLNVVVKSNDQLRIYGTLGRHDADGGVTYKVRGQRNYLFVKLKLGNGAQVTTKARDDFGVPHAKDLPVELRYEKRPYGVSEYVIVGQSSRKDLAEQDEHTSSGVPLHDHDNLYYRESEFIAASTGPDDAGKPVETGVNGLLSNTLLDVDGIVEDAAAAATEQATLTLTDRFLLLVDGVLKWASYQTIRDSIKAYYDSVVATLTNKSIDASANTLTNVNTSALANDAVSNAKLANMAANTVKGRITGSTGDPEDLTAANVRTIINVEDNADVTDAANVLAAGAVMTTGNHTIAGILTLAAAQISLPAGFRFQIASTVLADDTALQIYTGVQGGMLTLSVVSSTVAAYFGAIVSFRAASGPFCTVAASSSAVLETSTSILTGTTGTDGKFTVSATAANGVYVENRTGASITFVYYRST